jgi:hypothetical protein
MFDVTAGRSAGTARNAELDPTRPPSPASGDAVTVPVRDLTAGRSAGTAWNTAQDPTRRASADDPRR